MLRVTPIGSCRIAGPLNRAQDRFGIATNKRRVYGYCHASGEAVQMVRFLQGDFDPDPAVWPLISRGTSLIAIAAQTHDPSDLYLIELSSAKRLTIDGVFVQLNYVTNAFANFFADDDRARAFWIRAEDGDQAAIDRFLAKQPVSDTDRALLRLLRLSMTTPKQLRADITTLQALLPRLLIVTHTNARKSDGLPIATRAAFIDLVKDAARAVGVRVYDPTKRMLEMGQDRALADHSAGLAHYSDLFADTLGDDWLDIAIAPAVDDLARSGDALVLAPHIAALTGHVPFATLQERLNALAKAGAPVADIAASLEAAQQAIDRETDPIHASYLLGKFDKLEQALSGAKTPPAPEAILTYAKAAPTLHAQRILLLGLLAHPQSAAIADRLASALLADRLRLQNPLLGTLYPTLMSLISPLKRLKLCIAYGWTLEIVAQDLSADDATEVVAHLALTKGHDAALRFLKDWCRNNPLPSAASALMGQWCADADKGQKARAQLCLQILTLDPQNARARLTLRDIRRAVRDDMRKATDSATLDALAQVNALLPDPVLEVDLFRARACFTAGAYAEALEIGCVAAKALPNNLSIWVLIMRAAHRTKQAALAAEYAAQVMALATPQTSKFADEAAMHLAAKGLVSHD